MAENVQAEARQHHLPTSWQGEANGAAAPALRSYQVLPPLDGAEFEALKASIAAHGVQVPVEYDEQGNILDGHHRVRACLELGVKDWPSIVRGGMTEEEKIEHILSLNLDRRHLTREQRQRIREELRELGFSTRRISAVLREDQSTVVKALRRAGDEFSSPATVTGADGKTYPATRPRVVPSVFAATQRARERASEALRAIGSRVPSKVLELRRAERIAREQAAAARRTGPPVDAVCHRGVELRCGDFRKVLSDLSGTVDAIITDPPYAKRFWAPYSDDNVYADLGAVARELLKPDGVLAIMTGTRLEMLDAVDEQVGRHMRRRHRAVYLMPGPRWRDHLERVATGYKPVLIYAHPDGDPDALRWINDDVFVSGAKDKEYHEWGQSESGIASLVERLSEPGMLVVDPFLGGGTVAVACKRLGRAFVGCDIDPAAVAVAHERLSSHV